MPLLLARPAFAVWLDPHARVADLRGLIRPAAGAGLEALAVGPWVNDARHEGPRCFEPAAPGLLDQQAG